MAETLFELPFGATTIRAWTSARVTEVEGPRLAGPPPPVRPLLERALDAPVGSERVEQRVRAGDRVTLVVSDATRDEPRAELIAAVLDRLPEVRLTVAIASGTHGPTRGALPSGLEALAGRVHVLVDHDGHDDRDLVTVGTTARGTPVIVHRAVVDADMVVATGVIRPHYFAGWGAGAKAIFPGLGQAAAIRINHRWKTDPTARPGAVDDNVCRLDLEEAAAMAAPRSFLLDGVADAHGQVRGAVSGCLRAAFRAGVDLARPWVTRAAPRSRCIVVSDLAPVTDSLYQASKLVAAVAHLLLPGGTVVVVAPCPRGVGPVDVVNQSIYEIGLRPRLPADHRILLVSGCPAAEVSATYALAVDSLQDAIRGADDLLVVRGASKLLLE
ncbi:MAG: lactate racemase domain-containing protein [Deltaproteobacteria bacterium]|nr:lactate racemase domain-containing protein [Kofleriaceae bacterium]